MVVLSPAWSRVNRLRSAGEVLQSHLLLACDGGPNKEDSSIAKRVVEITIRDAPMKYFERTLTRHSRGDGAELCRDSGMRRLQATPPNQALEPTTLSVMNSAEPEFTPAKVVAHL